MYLLQYTYFMLLWYYYYNIYNTRWFESEGPNVRHRCTIDYIQPRGIRLYIGFFLYLLTIILYYIIRSQISYTQLILYCYYYTMRMLVFLVIGPTKCFVKRQTRFRNKIHDVYVARILRSIRKIVKFLSETHIKYEFSPSY